MYVFWKTSAGHPFEAALGMLAASPDVYDQALSSNLQFDHRVSEPREQTLVGALGAPSSKDSFKHSFGKYCDHHVRNSATPEFLDRALNGNNIIDPPVPLAIPKITDRDVLVNVCDLGNLRYAFEWARGEASGKWLDFLNGFSLQQGPLLRWLDGHLEGKPLDVQKASFLETAFAIANEYKSSQPYNPHWVVPWEKFRPYFEDPSRWLELVGCHKSGPRWLVLLRYTVAEVGGLVRPTQLEGGLNAWHYVSPPCKGVDGGIVMDLANVSPCVPPLEEYVHCQMDLKTDRVVRIEKVECNSGHHDILALRRQHYGSLCSCHSVPSTWHPNP